MFSRDGESGFPFFVDKIRGQGIKSRSAACVFRRIFSCAETLRFNKERPSGAEPLCEIVNADTQVVNFEVA